MNDLETTEVWRKLQAIGFRLDTGMQGIHPENPYLSYLAQVGLQPKGFEEAECDPRAPFDLLHAMRDYAHPHFDLRNVRIGNQTSFELNQKVYTIEWSGIGASFVEEVNRALSKEQAPFRWVWIEAYTPGSGHDHACTLLFLPLTVILGLAGSFEDEAEFLFDMDDVARQLAAGVGLAPAFDFNKTETVVYRRFEPTTIPRNLIFEMDAECIGSAEDYEGVLLKAFGLTSGRIVPESLRIVPMGESSCRVTFMVKGKKVSAGLEVTGWLDERALVSLLNAAAEKAELEERFFLLNSQDQGMRLTFMRQEDFMRHHECGRGREDGEARTIKEPRGLWGSLRAFFRPKP